MLLRNRAIKWKKKKKNINLSSYGPFLARPTWPNCFWPSIHDLTVRIAFTQYNCRVAESYPSGLLPPGRRRSLSFSIRPTKTSDHSRPPLLSSPKLPAHRAAPLSHPVFPTPATPSRLPPIPSSIPSFPLPPQICLRWTPPAGRGQRELRVGRAHGRARAPLRSPGGTAAAASVASAPRGWGCGTAAAARGARGSGAWGLQPALQSSSPQRAAA